ncbi:hypothetical protein [Dyadobacter sandarakinus]|uniref:Outer membrane protein beta-barrel domain-containing protein n=1 Tax=Dyadobacter sandarakinus TaxID=2747268 RepID=A0ABX7IB01_9BACT|nr:hypothetical protein [Dyadobacter sandarakinus]QRR03155.1 hypothetical protein HWI92_20670 [Dyadobacter sandarakinus]
MKIKLLLGLLLSAFLTNANAAALMSEANNKDSIVVTFGPKTRLVIFGESRKELETVMQYDLNALLRDLKVRLDSSQTDTTIVVEEFDGNEYLKNKSQNNQRDFVKIGLRGIYVKDGDTEVTINAKGVEVKDDQVTVTDSTHRKSYRNFYKSGFGSSPRRGFNIALGLNTFGHNDSQGYNTADYDLRPFGSRYISLGYVVSTRIAGGSGTRLHLDLGVDFSWYNFMFDGNNTVTKTNDKVEFSLVKDDEGKEMDLKKSKLTVPYVNLSLMPTLSFSRSFVSYISAGVYGGYRLGSYTKLRVEGSKDVTHDRRNFFVEDLRYGFAAELGIRNFPDFFVSYDLNELYQSNRGPAVKVLSFGIRLF